MQVGLVARCLDHADEGSKLLCQKQLWFGKQKKGKGRKANGGQEEGPNMTEDEARHRMKLWLVKGMAIPIDDPQGKKKHLALNPRTFNLEVEKSELQLDEDVTRMDPVGRL